MSTDLNLYDRKPGSPQRFGALNMTAALGPFVMRHPDIKDNMESFLVQHVLPEFTNEAPYMRSIVCLFMPVSGVTRGCVAHG